MSEIASMPGSISIRWRGPVGLLDVVRENDPADKALGQCGVYLWTSGSGSKLRYVGRAWKCSIWTRLRAHLLKQIGGSYIVPPEYLPSGSAPTGWAIDWQNQTCRETLQNVERFIAEVVRPSFKMAEDSVIWYANVDINFVRVVERQLIYDLQPMDNDPRTMTIPKHWIDVRHESAAWYRGEVKQRVALAYEASERDARQVGLI
jgi:hypothetical protein